MKHAALPRECIPLWFRFPKEEKGRLVITLLEQVELKGVSNFPVMKVSYENGIVTIPVSESEIPGFVMVLLSAGQLERGESSFKLVEADYYSEGNLSDPSYSNIHRVEILQPEIELSVSKQTTAPGEGFFNWKLERKNFVTIFNLQIEFALKDNLGNQQLIEKKFMTLDQWLNILERLPPDVDPSTYIGKFNFPHDEFTLVAQVRYEDNLGNKYTSNSCEISVRMEELDLLDSILLNEGITA